jgi:hypothetical protein
MQLNFHCIRGKLMVICKLPILLAERKMRVADLIRGTGINKQLCISFIMAN